MYLKYIFLIKNIGLYENKRFDVKKFEKYANK